MTAVHSHFRSDSRLRSRVRPGLQALSSEDVKRIEASIREECSDSLDLDSGLRPDHPEDPRWDYLVGHRRRVIAIEVHSALDSQVASIVGKKEHAKRQLLAHSRVGSSIASWLWIGSGSTQFTRREIAFRILAKHGIAFVGRTPGRKHLPKGS
jgi:hypothetical protein